MICARPQTSKSRYLISSWNPSLAVKQTTCEPHAKGVCRQDSVNTNRHIFLCSFSNLKSYAMPGNSLYFRA